MPTTYQQREVYVGQGDTPHDTQGTWSITRGTKADPDAVVYALDPDGSDSFIYYLKVDDNILLLLDQELNVRVGNASHGFTLSRTR